MMLRPIPACEPDPEAALALAKVIAPLLYGKHPGLVGAALAHLLATWLAGHFPGEVREDLLTQHIDGVRQMVPVIETELIAAMESAGRS
jgi:hypothetical protein